MLWEVLQRADCPKKFTKLIQQFHDGMESHIKVGNLESEPFNVSRGMKQGCIFAPILINVYLRFITQMLAAQDSPGFGVNINYRKDRSLFGLQKLKACTKIHRAWFLELQYADDYATLSHSLEGLQEAISKTPSSTLDLVLK